MEDNLPISVESDELVKSLRIYDEDGNVLVDVHLGRIQEMLTEISDMQDRIIGLEDQLVVERKRQEELREAIKRLIFHYKPVRHELMSEDDYMGAYEAWDKAKTLLEVMK